jgi:hypothetical protein
MYNSCATQSSPTLLDLTSSPDSRERLRALRELCPCHVKRNIPEVWDRILQLAHDEDVQVRSTVFHLLLDGSPRERLDEVVFAVGRMTQDADDKLRRRARKVMAEYRSTGRINVL